MPKKSRGKRRKRPPQPPTRAELVGSRFAVVHNQALLNSQRDTGIQEKIKARMKEETSEIRLQDLERRRLELLK